MRRKKGFLVVGLCISILFSYGCTNKKQSSKAIDISESTSLDQSQSYFMPDDHKVAKAEQGYYFLEAKSNCLYYYDYASKESTILCDKADCTHNNSDCMAYLDPKQYSPQVYYYEGYIYLIKYKGGKAVLEQVDKDGTARKELGELCSAEIHNSIQIAFCNQNVYVSYTDSNMSDDAVTISLICFSLDSQSASTIFSYTEVHPNIQQLKAYGDNLYFTIKTYKKDDTGKSELTGHGLYQLNDKTGETVQVLDGNINDYCLDTQNNKIYYYINSDGLYQYDIASANAKKIYEASDQSGMCRLSFDGQHVYMDNITWKDYSKHFMKLDIDVKKTCWVFNLDGSLLKEINLDDNVLLLHYGDSSCLFADVIVDKNGAGIYYLDKKQLLESNDGTLHWISVE